MQELILNSERENKKEEVLTKLESKITTSKLKRKFAEPKENVPAIKRGKRTGLFHALKALA